MVTTGAEAADAEAGERGGAVNVDGDGGRGQVAAGDRGRRRRRKAAARMVREAAMERKSIMSGVTFRVVDQINLTTW